MEDAMQAALYLGGTTIVAGRFLEPSVIHVGLSHKEVINQGQKNNFMDIDSVTGSRSEAMRNQMCEKLSSIRNSVQPDSVKQVELVLRECQN